MEVFKCIDEDYSFFFKKKLYVGRKLKKTGVFKCLNSCLKCKSWCFSNRKS